MHPRNDPRGLWDPCAPPAPQGLREPADPGKPGKLAKSWILDPTPRLQPARPAGTHRPTSPGGGARAVGPGGSSQRQRSDSAAHIAALGSGGD
eukprot:gene7959-biopygen2034